MKKVVCKLITKMLVLMIILNMMNYVVLAEGLTYGKDFTIGNVLSDYQYFVRGDLTATASGHAVGAVAVGGTLDTANTIGDGQVASSYVKNIKSIIDFSQGSWVTSYSSTYAEYRNTNLYYDAVEATVPSWLSTRFTYNPGYIDFNNAFTALQQESSTMSANGSNSYSLVEGTLTINLNPLGDTYVTIPYETIKNASSIVISGLSSIQDFVNHRYVISISGINTNSYTLSFYNMQFYDGSTYQAFVQILKGLVGSVNGAQINFEGMKLMWNFPDATGTISAMGLSGHLIAPMADVSVSGGNFEGGVIAKNCFADAEGHYFTFYKPGTTPEIAVSPATVPGAPTAVTATAGDEQVTITYTTPTSDGGSGITGYKIQVYDGITFVKTVDVASTETTAIITGLTNGKVYSFYVVAMNAVGDSAPSNILTATPVAPAPPATDIRRDEYNFDDGTAQGWSPRGETVTVTVTNEEAVSLPNSIKVTGRNGLWHGASINAYGKLYKSVTYTIKAKVKSICAETKPSAISLTMQQKAAADGADTEYIHIASTGSINDSNWHEISGTYSFTEDMADQTLYFESSDPNDSFYIDDICLTYIPPVSTQEIIGFATIPNISAGTAGSAMYSDAAEVIASLPISVTANASSGTVLVPVTQWVDTDAYNPNTPGSYTFTAILGAIPAGYANTGNYTATIEVTVEEQLFTVTVVNGTGSGSYAKGATVTITANDRRGYTFTGWSSSDVTLANTNVRTTTFIMPEKNVTVTANYSQNSYHNDDGGSPSGNDSNTVIIIVTPPTAEEPGSPTQVEIKVPVTVDANNNATVNITSQNVTEAYDKAVEEAKKNGNEQNGITVVLRVDTGNKTGSNIMVNLPKSVQDVIIAKKIINIIVVVDNPGIRIGMDLTTVEEINRQANSDVNITATLRDSDRMTGDASKAIGSRPAFDLKVNYGSGKQVENFGPGSVLVTIPYTLGENEKAGNVQAVYVDGNGRVHWLVNSVYDSMEKVLRFSTNHFSTYAIGYKQDAPSFTDIANHYRKDDIEFVTIRGLLEGTGTTTFEPDRAITRGMLVTALGRMADADVSSYKDSSFTDVKNNAYYMGCIEWANKLGILSGIDGKFYPDKAVTREDMAVILSKYAKAMGITLEKVYEESSFEDKSKINDYAKDPVKELQMAGIITGKSNNLFDPTSAATRSEVSAMLRRLIERAAGSSILKGWIMNDSGKWMYYEKGKAVTGRKEISGLIYEFNQYGETASSPGNPVINDENEQKEEPKEEPKEEQPKNPSTPNPVIYTTYRVKKGDSFWKISRMFKCNMYELAKINNKTIKDIIYPGEVLKIPKK